MAPRYQLEAPAYINDHLHAVGDTVETDLMPGPHMRPALDRDGKEDQEARRRCDIFARAQLKAPGHPEYFGDMAEHYDRDGQTHGRINAASGQAAPGLANPRSAMTPFGVPPEQHDVVVAERDRLAKELAEAKAAAAGVTPAEAKADQPQEPPADKKGK